MPSPFPGMNPYLERAAVWQDFHESFIPRLRDEIVAQVVPRYFVRIDEHMYIHALDTGERTLVGIGDVVVPARDEWAVSTGLASSVLEAPAEVGVPEFDQERLSFLEVRDRENNELITVIELLSPANKYVGADRQQYLAKAVKLQRSPVHFVEIDLLRGGPRMPWLDMAKCDYCVEVSRAEKRPRAGIWPILLRDPLPVIPIPLRAGDRDALVNLQKVLHQIYDAAGYAYHIYSGPPEPALSDVDASWANSVVADHTLAHK